MIWLSVAYGFLALLLVLSFIHGRGGRSAKTALLALSIAWSFAVWHSLGTLSGWPKWSIPPAQSQFVSLSVREPNPTTGDQGYVCLWVIPEPRPRPLLGYQPRQGVPRAYCQPYSRQLHEQAYRAQQATQRGTPVRLVRVRVRRRNVDGQVLPKWAWRFQNIRPPALPPKDGG